MLQFQTQFMMGILIASTAFAGLTGVVIGQMMQQWLAGRHAPKGGLLLWSIVLGIAAVLSVLSWFSIQGMMPELEYVWILLILANTLFVAQMLLFVFGTFIFWGTK